jgi:single-stranded-DNA-specific exonuclease
MTTRLSLKHMHWELAPIAPTARIEELAQGSHVSPFMARLLYGRGLTTVSAVTSFLACIDPHHDPLLMHDMRAAAERIISAIHDQEAIAVYGDFDADGITATSLICDAFRQLGANIAPYIPHRTAEGYGLNHEAMHRLAQSGVTLLVTVDCGISNVSEVALARELGMDVIITDHHAPPTELPVATALVNPKLPDCPYPDKGLVGVGIAYKLIQAIGQLGMPLSAAQMTNLLDLVALGTVADLGPLQGENRSLVARGLQVLANSQRPGIRALIAVAGIAPASLKADDIGFKLGPRINAAGRLDDAVPAYELLLTDDFLEAQAKAQHLNEINIERQHQTKLLQERVAAALSDADNAAHAHDRIIVHADPDAHAGLVGLAAARIADQFARPAIIIERGEPHSRGSARSGGMINMVEALRNCGATFIKMGGHAAAAGFTIESALIDNLRQSLNEYAVAQDIRVGTRSLHIDCEVPHEAVSIDLITELSQLEPCGHSNHSAVLLTRNCRVINAQSMGSDNKHLRLKLDLAGRVLTAIAWGEGAHAHQFTRITAVDIVFHPQRNEWNGRVEVQLIVHDLRSARPRDAAPQAPLSTIE